MMEYLICARNISCPTEMECGAMPGLQIHIMHQIQTTIFLSVTLMEMKKMSCCLRGDWCDWEMHEKFIDIMKYDATSDSVEHERVVIANKQYSEDSSRKWMDGVTFYDNGTILSDYTYGMIAGQCLYTYEYDSSKDVYSGISGNEIIKDYSNRAGALWDKTQEVYRYNNDVNFLMSWIKMEMGNYTVRGW